MTVLSVYKLLRSRIFDIIVLGAVMLLLVAEAVGSPDPHAQQFTVRSAEASAEAIVHPTVSAYLALVNSLHEDPLWQSKVESLYADELYYSDTFLVAFTREQVTAHFARLRESGGRFKVAVLDVVQGRQGVYLVWGLDSGGSSLSRFMQAGSVGITLFRFDAQGRITLQQDFWDSPDGFYRHIPVVGSSGTATRDGVSNG